MYEILKDTIQDCNINCLIGSGLSAPYLSTLGCIETLLTALDEKEGLHANQKKVIRASLYKKYFDDVIAKNINVLNPDAPVRAVLDYYHTFLRTLNAILQRRRVTILSKEANLFTTNIDVLLEKSLEDLQLEVNDGFSGRFRPKFSLSNFKKSHYKRSLHFDNSAEIPVFNLSKLHGSLSWEFEGKDIVFSTKLSHVREVEKNLPAAGSVLPVDQTTTLEVLIGQSEGMVVDASIDAFLETYDKLLIVVNPTKEKFRHTLLNQTYYELLRLYSNELEKENTVLFVMGFSFADEHIREITIRAANSNPTLMIYVFAHSANAKTEIEGRIGHESVHNNNLTVIAPERRAGAGGAIADEFNYDLATLNERVFGRLLKLIEGEKVEEVPVSSAPGPAAP
jgi:hypothetical protein